MSVTIDALTSAAAGLQAANARINTLSRNIANASTDGYSRKVQQQTTSDQGIVVEGPIQRTVDAVAKQLLNQSTASENLLSTTSNALSQLEATFGSPDQNTGLSAALTGLQNAFQTLAVNPQKDSVYDSTVSAAQTVASTFNTLWNAAETQRTNANTQIATTVTQVNQILSQLADTNSSIQAAGGGDTTDLLDHRDQLVSQLSGLLGITTSQAPDGTVSVYTTSGHALLDATVHPLDPAQIGGTQVAPPAGPVTVITTGTLGGLLQTRDQTMPQYQSQLDDMARATSLEFSNIGINLFNDGGNVAFSLAPAPNPPTAGQPLVAATPTQVTGFAGRIAVNSAIVNNPASIRDGNSPTPLDPADTTFIDQATALFERTNVAFNSSVGLPANGSFADVATGFVTQVASASATAKNALTQEQSINQIYSTAVSQASGVNVDDEMSQLIVLQNAYSANARVISTTQALFTSLLGALQ
jgi:flagellar hook-associated protein 1